MLIKNFNPRNLEQMRIAIKSHGWPFQEYHGIYWNRLLLQKHSTKRRSAQYTGTVTNHRVGELFRISTTDEIVRVLSEHCSQSMYAVHNVRLVAMALAVRCNVAGIEYLHFDESQFTSTDRSVELSNFKQPFVSAGIDLKEPDELKAPRKPGVDYDAQPTFYHKGPKEGFKGQKYDDWKHSAINSIRQRGSYVSLDD